MSDVFMTTVFGVVGTGLIAMFFMQLQNLREDLRQGLQQQSDAIKSLQGAVVQLQVDVGQFKADVGQLKGAVVQLQVDVGQLKGAVVQLQVDVGQLKADVSKLGETAITHGVRLARIEQKLDIDDSSAEAA